jgi:hypothetical protein
MMMGVERVGRMAVAAALLTVSAGCAAAPLERPIPTTRIDSGTGSLTAARKYLEGRWTLESFEVHPPGKAPLTLKGSGVLEYDDFGNLRMEIRADPAASDLLNDAGIEIRNGVVSTEGRTSIDLQNRTLTYILEGQPTSGGGPLAQNRPRHWEVTADTLTLTTRDESGGPLAISRWRRGP